MKIKSLNYLTSSYKIGKYQVDLVQTINKDGDTVTDVWLSEYNKYNKKLYIFGLVNKPISKVLEIVVDNLIKENDYTKIFKDFNNIKK